MRDHDSLFNDFLHYLSKWRSGETPDSKQYFKNKPYSLLWNSFLDLFLKGVCPPAMQAALEHEKWKLLKSSITDDDALETILLEKLLYHFYLGDDRPIAELANNFTSNQLRAKYAVLLDQLWNSESAAGKDSGSKENLTTKTSCEATLSSQIDESVQNYTQADPDDPAYNSGQADTYNPADHSTRQADMNESADHSMQTDLEQCFLGLQMEIDSMLEIQKIEFIRRILKMKMPKKIICTLFPDMDPLYLDTIISCKDDNTYDLYTILFNKQLVNIKPPIFNYKNLNHTEMHIYQLLQYYFMNRHSES